MRRTLTFSSALIAISAFVATAGAGVITLDPTITVVAGGEEWSWSPEGYQDKNGDWNYEGSRTEAAGNGSWTLDFSVQAPRPDEGAGEAFRGAQTAFLFNNLVMTNNTGMTQTISITTMIPVAPAILPSSLMGGSAAGTLSTNGDGGTLSNVLNSLPMYRALIDGLPVGGVADLHLFDSSISAPAFDSASTGSESFGQPAPSAPGPAIFSSIGITLQFDLTDGDAASWTSNFVVNVIPGPGSGVLLGLAGFAAIRRRR